MSDSEKPFACNSPGCNMSFANEDHLTVHKKKHDMVLHLGNGKNTVFVDQTPTPTRFIRNCEEVGLFQDLQNVNPFDETFRRAVESGKPGTLTISQAGLSDDSLHTPHIFPNIQDIHAINAQILSQGNIQESLTEISITEKTLQDKNTIETEICTSIKVNSYNNDEVVKSKDNCIESNDSVQSKVLSDQTSALQKDVQKVITPPLVINGEEVQLLLKTADGKLMKLSAAPVNDSDERKKNQTLENTKQQSVIIRTEPPLKCTSNYDPSNSNVSRLSLAKLKLKEVLAKNTRDPENQEILESSSTTKEVTSPRKRNSYQSVDQSKKDDMLERNRASSSRARAKRKAWVQTLETTLAGVNKLNSLLQTEVKTLREEVTKLKTLLLAHKDCPVTKQMEKGNGIVVDSKVLPLNSCSVTIPISTNITSVKRPNSDKNSRPSKRMRPLITKPPVILPKINVASQIQPATVVKTIPTIKIMDVNPFINEKNTVKPIIIIPSKKSNEIPTQQIMQVDTNFAVEHAASKTTGT